MSNEIEYDEYIKVWSLTAESALQLFGFTADTHEAICLKQAPEIEREIAKFRPDDKLFGLKVKVQS